MNELQSMLVQEEGRLKQQKTHGVNLKIQGARKKKTEKRKSMKRNQPKLVESDQVAPKKGKRVISVIFVKKMDTFRTA